MQFHIALDEVSMLRHIGKWLIRPTNGQFKTGAALGFSEPFNPLMDYDVETGFSGTAAKVFIDYLVWDWELITPTLLKEEVNEGQAGKA